MTQKFANNARARLASAINTSATTIVLEAASGDLFPVATRGIGLVGDWFKCTLQDALGDVEIIHVRTRASGADLLEHVLRAQEGTTAKDWPAGSVIGLRLTAGDVEKAIAQDWSAIPEEDLAPVAGVKTLSVDARGNHVDTDTSDIKIPPATFSKGDVVVIFNNDTANHKITPDAGVTLIWDDAKTGERTIEPNGLATLFCAGSDKFRLVGAGVS